MSSADFASNNQDANNGTAGRGQRSRIPTAAIAQHNEAEARKASSRARRKTCQVAPQASLSFTNMSPPLYPSSPDLFHFQNQNNSGSMTVATAPFSSSPNPFYPNNLSEQHGLPLLDWQLALANKQLFTLTDATGAAPPFYPEEEDEIFSDPEADSAGDGPLRDGVAEESSSAAPVPSAVVAGGDNQTATQQNLRTFPPATANMSSTNVEQAPPRLIRRANRPSYAGLSSPSSSSDAVHSPAPPSTGMPGNGIRQPLIHRTNIFGPGLHDARQRPRQSPTVQTQTAKENVVHGLSDDELAEAAPPKKKSRKEPAARSIVNIAPERIPVIEKAYGYMYMKTLTNESRTWVHGRAELAEFSQEAFNWALDQLGLHPDDFEPVTYLEQDLCRERIYGPRKDFKKAARIITASPDGFGFLTCSAKATKEEQERVATANRVLVAALTDRSAYVFEDPHDRTVKGSMYKHCSIGLLINRVVFANMLSLGMQYPEFFDDTFPDTDDDMQPPHKPTLCLVIIAIAVTALRGAIMEYSSGHYLAEDFSRKVYKSHFDAELKTLREWLNFTSNPTLIPGGGPMRMAPATFLTRTLQEDMFAEARYNVLKDVVAPVPSAEVMDHSDFALNQ
ncbi:hypothetical protein B0H13DRAFT_2348784 [Mycena leptocephala]|nr:hypothetical protein B0H13DRAFT_2348784 [Mycena leptocephala]